MPTRCPSRVHHRPFFVVRAVVVGSVLSAVLPANAIDTMDFRRATYSQAFAPPNARIELTLPASVLDTPVHLRARTEDLARSGGFEVAPIVPKGAAIARLAGFSRQAVPPRPTVIILTPTDLATVPAGTLPVRGTVSANGDKVRVLVNGVRAVVQQNTFTAAVRVTPNTMILSAVATTPRGVTARHQIGLTVSGTAENTFRLRPFPGYGVAALTKHFSLLSAAVSASAKADLGSDGDGGATAPSPGGLPFTSARASSYYSPVYMTPVDGTTGAATIALVLAPGVLDEHRSGKEPVLTEKLREAGVERARSVLVMNAGPEYRAEPTTLQQRGSSAPALAGIGSLRPGQSRDGEVEQNPRGMRRGTEYSFGVLFIFDTNGFWRVRWY
jgi:hypothetical protein